MNISSKRQAALYDAIHEPIIKKRIEVQKAKNELGVKATVKIDQMLFVLEKDIWKEVAKALNLSDTQA